MKKKQESATEEKAQSNSNNTIDSNGHPIEDQNIESNRQVENPGFASPIYEPHAFKPDEEVDHNLPPISPLQSQNAPIEDEDDQNMNNPQPNKQEGAQQQDESQMTFMGNS